MFFTKWLWTLPIPIRIVQWTILHIRIQIHLVVLSYWISTYESTRIRRIVSRSIVVVTRIILELSSCVESRVSIESTSITTESIESISYWDIGFTIGIVGVLLDYESCRGAYSNDASELVGMVVVSIGGLPGTGKAGSLFIVWCNEWVSSDTVEVVLFKGQWNERAGSSYLYSIREVFRDNIISVIYIYRRFWIGGRIGVVYFFYSSSEDII